jgi:hypothetical protein
MVRKLRQTLTPTRRADLSRERASLESAEPNAVENETNDSLSERDLLRVLIGLLGRALFPAEQLAQIVGPYVSAYNSCNGEATIASIAKSNGLDKSNLRKAILKWEQAGALFRVGPEGRPLRLYVMASKPSQGRESRRTDGILQSDDRASQDPDES